MLLPSPEAKTLPVVKKKLPVVKKKLHARVLLTFRTSDFHSESSSLIDIPSVCFDSAQTPNALRSLNKLSRVVVNLANSRAFLSKKLG